MDIVANTMVSEAFAAAFEHWVISLWFGAVATLQDALDQPKGFFAGE